ncbi:LCP family protein [Streptomyces sp. HNM0574]|nr:LCP family protein [Streptomyces sp. HNM0574]
MVSGLDSGVRRVDPFGGLGDRPEAGNGVNFLVAGTDGRDKLSKEQREKYRLGGTACNCTDTLMLVHLSADRSRASVVSLPRDTYTKLPAHTHRGKDGKPVERRDEPAKLNSAYAHGGPNLTVSTVEKLTRVHIDHYLEVDFGSFMSTVDVIGGVPVCTTKPLKDSHSGLDLPAGTSRLNGGEALQYVRARHLDGGSDLGRMQRQQRFLAALLDEATSSGVLMNPVKFNELASTLLKSVRADHGFGSEQIVALGRVMRNFTPASSEFASVPLADPGHQVPGLGSTVKWDEEKAGELFTALREDRPLARQTEALKKQRAQEREEARERRAQPEDAKAEEKADEKEKEKGPAHVEVAPGSVRVQVENGTSETGTGHRADRELGDAGFATTGTPRNAKDRDVERTEIAYDPRWDRSARSLAAALPDAKLVKDPGRGPQMKVTVGADFEKVRPVRQSVADGPPAGRNDGGAVTGDQVTCK